MNDQGPSLSDTWLDRLPDLAQYCAAGTASLRSALLEWLCGQVGAGAGIFVSGEEQGESLPVIWASSESARSRIRTVSHRGELPLPIETFESRGREFLQIRLEDPQGISRFVLLLEPSDTNPQIRQELLRLRPLLDLLDRHARLLEVLAASRQQLVKFQSESLRIAGQNQRLFEEMLSQRTRLQGISKGVIKIQEEERSRISRELHDGIGQALTALKISLDLHASDTMRMSSEVAGQRVEQMRKLVAEAIQETRELSRFLRPRMLDDLGLLPTLQWYTRTFSQNTGLQIELVDDLQDKDLDPELETLIFRVTQEALNNIVKHSGSKTARVLLAQSRNKVKLTISDRGQGFEVDKILADPHSGSGIRGIRDRVALLDGRLDIQSRSREGTTVKIVLPIARQEATR